MKQLKLKKGKSKGNEGKQKLLTDDKTSLRDGEVLASVKANRTVSSGIISNMSMKKPLFKMQSKPSKVKKPKENKTNVAVNGFGQETVSADDAKKSQESKREATMSCREKKLQECKIEVYTDENAQLSSINDAFSEQMEARRFKTTPTRKRKENYEAGLEMKSEDGEAKVDADEILQETVDTKKSLKKKKISGASGGKKKRKEIKMEEEVQKVAELSSVDESGQKKETKEIKIAANLGDEVSQISSIEEDTSKGMKKWLNEYQKKRPGLKILQQNIDEFMTDCEAREEKARKEREAQAAEGGWTVVVHHKGRKKTTDSESGIAVGSVAQAAVMDNLSKKKNKEIPLNFYRFQKREARRNEMMSLQSRFEQDKKRIQQLRAARKFRPY